LQRSERFLNLALKIAAKSDHPFYRMGAVLVKGNRVISIGLNKHKTNPNQLSHHGAGYAGSIHAELDAMISNNTVGCDLYVARIMANGTAGMAKPCQNCMKLCYAYGIKKVFFTTGNGYEFAQIS
jgi:deoxycytidylate deaminase